MPAIRADGRASQRSPGTNRMASLSATALIPSCWASLSESGEISLGKAECWLNP
jgi:hypothetical protein